MQIICDTDFLMKITNDPLPKFDFKSLSNENEFVTIPAVVRELKGLTLKVKRETSVRANNTLRTLNSGSLIRVLSEVEDHGEADSALLEYVRLEPEHRILATLDGSLLNSLEKCGLGYLTLSSGRALIRGPRQQRI